MKCDGVFTGFVMCDGRFTGYVRLFLRVMVNIQIRLVCYYM